MSEPWHPNLFGFSLQYLDKEVFFIFFMCFLSSWFLQWFWISSVAIWYSCAKLKFDKSVSLSASNFASSIWARHIENERSFDYVCRFVENEVETLLLNIVFFKFSNITIYVVEKLFLCYFSFLYSNAHKV